MALTIISSSTATGGSWPHKIFIYIGVELISQNVVANTSTIRIKTWLENKSTGEPWNIIAGDNAYYLRVDGASIVSGYQPVDFRSSSIHVIADRTITKTHSATGDLSLLIETRQAIDGVATFDYAWRQGTYTAPRIIRASTLTAPGGYVDDAIALTISKAAGVYNHDLRLYVGTTLIATRTSVTTPTSLVLTTAEWAAYYNATKTAATSWPELRLTSKLQDGTILDDRSVYPGLTYKSTVIPTTTGLTATDGDAKVIAVMGQGNFVQTLSDITAAIVGAAGVKSSTIAAYELIIGSTKYTSVNKLFTPASSGSIVITGRVQDSRGRWSSKRTLTIIVIPYSKPKISNYKIIRTNSAGVADQLGTYAKHTATASVPSVKVGTIEKNQLRYYIQNVTGTPVTVLSTQIIVGLAASPSHTLGTYAIQQSYVFRLTALDKFDQTYAVDITLPDARIPFSWGPYGGSFGGIFDVTDPAVLQVSGDLNIKDGNLKKDGDKYHIMEKIPASVDLNDYMTPGTYYCPTNSTVETILNRPTNLAFALRIEKHAGVSQVITIYEPTSHAILHRNYYSGVWGEWKAIDGGVQSELYGSTATYSRTAYGYILFGPQNSTWAHIYTDRPNFYFNKEIYVNGDQLEKVYARGGNYLNGWENLPGGLRRVWKTYTATIAAAEMVATGPAGAFKSGWKVPGNWAAGFTQIPRIQAAMTVTDGSWAWLGSVKKGTTTGAGEFFIYKFGATSASIEVFFEAVGPY